MDDHSSASKCRLREYLNEELFASRQLTRIVIWL
jgi:hypothetical protein